MKIRLYRPTYKTAQGERRKSPTWWLDFTDADGRRWRWPALADRRASEAVGRRVLELAGLRASGDALTADLSKWLEGVPADFRARLAEAGLIDRERAGVLAVLLETDAAGKVTGGHLADFLADAQARNVSPVQRTMLAQRVRDVLKTAGAKWARDLTAARIQAAIGKLGAASEGRPDGLSLQSLHHYVRAVKQFSRWLHRNRRTADDALVGLRGFNVETDKRHERRGFTADEIAALLTVTRGNGESYGMSGPARAAAYALAFASGLRRNEIRTLTAASFDLTADPPTVTVEAGYSKHRRQDVQPLPADVADLLADYLATADAGKPLPLPDKTAAMLREDMADTRALQARGDEPDFLMPEDSRGLVLDFHSFRHGFVTSICKAAVSPRVMMQLARHSDPRLTMKRYSRLATAETATALDALPRLNAAPEPERATLRATGTFDAQAAPDAVASPRTSERPDGRPSARPEGRTAQASDGRPAGRGDAKTPGNHFAIPFAKSCGFQGNSLDGSRRNEESGDGHKRLDSNGKAPYSGQTVVDVGVAQLDRASVYGTEGYRFESRRPYFREGP